MDALSMLTARARLGRIKLAQQDAPAPPAPAPPAAPTPPKAWTFMGKPVAELNQTSRYRNLAPLNLSRIGPSRFTKLTPPEQMGVPSLIPRPQAPQAPLPPRLRQQVGHHLPGLLASLFRQTIGRFHSTYGQPVWEYGE